LSAAAPGVTAVEPMERGSGRSDLEAARSSSKPPQARGFRVQALSIIRDAIGILARTWWRRSWAKRHGVTVAARTVRKWMIADGLWLDRKQRVKRVISRVLAEVRWPSWLQIDGAHWWFEDEGAMHDPVFVDEQPDG